MANEIAKVHVDGYDPEVYTGEDALIMANAAASLFREDFPDGVIGVSYNRAAAESKRKLTLKSLGMTDEDIQRMDAADAERAIAKAGRE